MLKKDEEKNKVGRPKLADNITKRDSIITLSVALAFALMLIINGSYTLKGDLFTNKLVGAATTSKVTTTTKSKTTVKSTTKTTTKTTTVKPNSCSITVSGGKSLTYNVTCNGTAKFTKVVTNISNEYTTLTKTSGTVTPQLTSFKREGYATVYYNNGKNKVKSKNVEIDNTNEYQNQCLNSGVNKAKENCKAARYHVINTSTYCRVYAYNKSGSTALAIRCDSNAAPFKTELYEYNSKKKTYGKLVDRDLKWHRNVGYWSDDASSSKKLTKGKEYVYRIVYKYNDRTDGKNSWNEDTLTNKMDQATVIFKAGDNGLKTLDDTIKKTKNSDNDYYGTAEFKKTLTKDNKCAVKYDTKNSDNRNAKYVIACGKNAVPGSLRIMTGNKKGLASYVGDFQMSYTSKYLNGKTSTGNSYENGGTIRTLFATEAKNSGADAYGMTESGNMMKLPKGSYKLVLYYGYKKSDGTKTKAQIRTTSQVFKIK